MCHLGLLFYEQEDVFSTAELEAGHQYEPRKEDAEKWNKNSVTKTCTAARLVLKINFAPSTTAVVKSYSPPVCSCIEAERQQQRTECASHRLSPIQHEKEVQG